MKLVKKKGRDQELELLDGCGNSRNGLYLIPVFFSSFFIMGSLEDRRTQNTGKKVSKQRWSEEAVERPSMWYHLILPTGLNGFLGCWGQV